MSEHYHQQWSNKSAQGPLAEMNRLKDENAALRAQLAALRESNLTKEYLTNSTDSYANQREVFLTGARLLGYNSAREYIEAMATKYSVGVEKARMIFMACGYEDWNTGFIETLMEMSEGE